MSWVVTVVTVAAAVYSAQQSREAGKQQQYNLERQAEQERLSAEDQEIQRRDKLNKVLSANIASAAASGTLGEGSQQSIAIGAAQRVASSEGAESLSERMRQDLLRREGKAAKTAGDVQAASTLLNAGVKAARTRSAQKTQSQAARTRSAQKTQ
jgi:hypothetical protein